MSRLIECVPNFSEGRDPSVIRQITDQIETVEGARLLDVDPGKATNRTVVTIVGEPEAVIEAAVRAVRKAAEVIDMSKHSGEHPRFGATDVCPLVPVAGVTMEETVQYAHRLAQRLGEEVGITIYCYENAARSEDRRNLATVRAGEYEGLEARLADPRWKPDFGPATFNPASGATAVGARDFLAAYNANLNTTSSRRANAIAFDVREKGRIKREPDPVTGEIVRGADGEPLWTPGTLKAVKGIGWYIEEYGICQVSMNLTNLSITSVHKAFEACCMSAAARGVRVTGSELVGMVPLATLTDAGRHFLRKQQRSTGVSDAELIKIAVRSMGLDELGPFDPAEKIIEYKLAEGTAPRLVDMSLADLVAETASESPAPGGGSVAAALGALGAALGTMVANLSSHKRGWDARWEEFSDWAERGKSAQVELLALVDADTEAFNAIMAAWRVDPAEREAAIETATLGAIEVPLRVMEVAVESMDVLEAMARQGLAASISDAGVGALCARAAALGAHLNVCINAKDLKDESARRRLRARADELAASARRREEEILRIVGEKVEG